MRIKKDHGLLDLAVHHLKFHFEAQCRGQFEALCVVAYVQAANDEFPFGILPYHSLHINDRQVLREVVARIVKHTAHGSVSPAHHALHSIDSTEEVAAMDADRAACAYKDVFVVVRHADDFMWNDLPD